MCAMEDPPWFQPISDAIPGAKATWGCGNTTMDDTMGTKHFAIHKMYVYVYLCAAVRTDLVNHDEL